MKSFLTGFFFFLSAVATTACAAGRCAVVDANGNTATIVLAAKPTLVAQVAAAELNYYVEKITGHKLSIVSDAAPLPEGPKILVGESELTRKRGLTSAGFERQEYLVKTDGDTLILMGHDHAETGEISYKENGFWPKFSWGYQWIEKPDPYREFGSCYAVHTFLEKYCGVRWIMPTEIGEVCPKAKSIVAENINLRRRPWFRYRLYIPVNFGKYENFPGSGLPRAAIGSNKAGWRDLYLWRLRTKILGCERLRINHTLIGPWFKAKYPNDTDIFADAKVDSHHLCLSSPKLKSILHDLADQYFAGGENPLRQMGDYFTVMPHDYSRYWCGCDGCKKWIHEGWGYDRCNFWHGKVSDYTWQLVNDMARYLKKNHPGRWAACCAYAGYTLPPEKVELEDNIAVMFCRVLCNYPSEKGYKQFAKKYMRRWAQKAGRFFVWEYFDHIQSNGYQTSFPLSYPRMLVEEFQFLKEIGARGMFIEGNSYNSLQPNFTESQLNVYVALQLLRDPDLNLAALLDDYYEKFYGPAAKPMKAFNELLETRGADPANYKAGHGYKGRLADSWEHVCPPDVLAVFERHINDARAAAKGKGIYEDRVELFYNAVFGMMVKNCQTHNFGYVKHPAFH